jgi:DDE superfamily endonuclease
VLLEAWFALADAGAQAQAAEALPVQPLPDRLESVSPSGAGQAPPEAPADASVAVVEDTLLPGEGSPSKLAQLWEGATGAILLAFILYYHGLSLEVIGRFFGVHKTTGRRWLSPLAHVNWQGAVPQSKRFFSGTVAVDEKGLKVAGVWWYLFVAVDHVSGFPLHVALLPSNATPYCALFLLQLKARGYHPTVIITDGWDAYVKAIARVFPNAQHCCVAFMSSAPPCDDCANRCPVATPEGDGPTNSRRSFGPPRSAPCSAAWTRSKAKRTAARLKPS